MNNFAESSISNIFSQSPVVVTERPRKTMSLTPARRRYIQPILLNVLIISHGWWEGMR
jgi:hypothetical protein